MSIVDCEKTDRSLVDRVVDWRDASAWVRFDATYRPMVRRWGRRFGLDGDDLEELCQVVMIWLSRKLERLRDDPPKAFRAWLRCVVSSRAIDLIRARRRATPLVDPGEVVDPRPQNRPKMTTSIVCPADARLRAVPDEVVLAVQRRVRPENWQIFWMVRVEGKPINEVRHLFGKTYAATFRNQERVARMLQKELERFRSLQA